MSHGTGLDIPSEPSRRGTACHLLLGVWLRGEEIEHLVGLTEPETGIEITPEMVLMVKDVAKWLFGYVALSEPMPLVRHEVRIEVGAAFGCPDELWGTADFVAVGEDEILVADAKFGFLDVEVEGNEQVSLYTIGVAEEYGWPDKKYKLAILQPRSNPPFKTETLSRDELLDRRARYLPKIKAALEPNGALVPTERGCEYCPAAGRCPALQRRAQKSIELVFSAPPEQLSTEELGHILDEAALVRGALRSAEQYALQALSLGLPMAPGWKRVSSRKHRQWKDESGAAQVLSELGAKEEELWKRKLISPAQAEKLLNVPRRTFDEIAPAPEGEPELVRESDPRPALDSVFGHKTE